MLHSEVNTRTPWQKPDEAGWLYSIEALLKKYKNGDKFVGKIFSNSKLLVEGSWIVKRKI